MTSAKQLYLKFIKFKRGYRKNIKIFRNSVEVYIELLVYEQICPHCGIKTSRLTGYIANELRNLVATSDISKSVNVSPSFISKLLPFLAISSTSLLKILYIDEFKGNASNHKYQVTLIDGETHKVVDIIKCRYKHVLCDYFKKFLKGHLIILYTLLLIYRKPTKILV